MRGDRQWWIQRFIDGQREEKSKVEEKNKREREQMQWCCFTVCSKDGGTGTEKWLSMCGLIIELMDGGRERRMIWRRAAANEELSDVYEYSLSFSNCVCDCVCMCVCVYQGASWSRCTARQTVWRQFPALCSGFNTICCTSTLSCQDYNHRPSGSTALSLSITAIVPLSMTFLQHGDVLHAFPLSNSKQKLLIPSNRTKHVNIKQIYISNECISAHKPLWLVFVVCVRMFVFGLMYVCAFAYTLGNTLSFSLGAKNVCVRAQVFMCEIPLGAVAPAGWGCPPVSWQSSGSHGNEARDAPAPDLWYSLPPEELQDRERWREKKRARERWRVKQTQSLRPHLKCMNKRNLRGASENCRNWSRPKEKLVRPITAAHPSFIRLPLCC